MVDYPGLIVKDSYWRWPERDLAGNAIDFCIKILGLSFNDASAVKQAHGRIIGERQVNNADLWVVVRMEWKEEALTPHPKVA